MCSFPYDGLEWCLVDLTFALKPSSKRLIISSAEMSSRQPAEITNHTNVFVMAVK